MDQRDSEIEAIEQSLGEKLVPLVPPVTGTIQPLAEYARIETEVDAEGYQHVWLAHKEGSNARVSIGEVSMTPCRPPRPLGTLHLHTSSVVAPAGDVLSVAGSADDLVIENDINVGITLLTREGRNCNIDFGGPVAATSPPQASSMRARIQYDGSSKNLDIGPHEDNGEVQIRTGDVSHALVLDKNGAATFNLDVTAPSLTATGDVTASSLTATGDVTASSLTATGNSINIATPDASPTGGTPGDIRWDDDNIYVRTSAGWKSAALS